MGDDLRTALLGALLTLLRVLSKEIDADGNATQYCRWEGDSHVSRCGTDCGQDAQAAGDHVEVADGLIRVLILISADSDLADTEHAGHNQRSARRG